MNLHNPLRWSPRLKQGLTTLGLSLTLLCGGLALPAQARHHDNPPGPVGGRGTNWENPPGPAGGPGASPDRHVR